MSTPPPTVNPPPAPPPPKDVPWWGALILAILTAIVSVIGTIYALRGQKPSVGGPPGIGTLFTDTITYLPHILILFGVLADIFTMAGVYSIPSLVGLLSIPAHYGLQFVWTGAQAMVGDIYKLATTAPAGDATPPSGPRPGSVLASTTGGAINNYSGCEIQGFESLKSPFAPQGLVVTSTIFWYYLLDLLMNRNILDGVGTIVTFVIFIAFQVFELKTCEDLAGSVAVKTLISLIEGIIIGGLGYSVVQMYAPNRLPSSVLPQGPSAASLTKNANGEMVDSSGTVYIIGPNGQPIPKSFVAQTCAGGGSDGSEGAGGVGGMYGPSGAGSCPK
jgi:hypothetical protein